jgi:hypothetical protein
MHDLMVSQKKDIEKAVDYFDKELTDYDLVYLRAVQPISSLACGK